MALVKPKARDDLTVVELDGEAVIYDEATTELHHLNPTATIVFRLCDGASTMHQMSVDIADAFGVPVEEVEPQVRGLIRRFRKVGLLEGAQRSGYASDRTERTPAAP